MKKLITIFLVSCAFFIICSSAHADWFQDDPHKMHYPQMPDPQGWDIALAPQEVADDWKCSQTGPVSDIHFWYSWQGDRVGQIRGINVNIYSDKPAPDSPASAHSGRPEPNSPGYSMPNELLWSRYITDFKTIPYGEGTQGWAEPLSQIWETEDHHMFYQVNIVDIIEPFIQEIGTIYWLGLQIDTVEGQIGWKTSLDHWNDDAVIGAYTAPWMELIDPYTGNSIDMAFVITPEPATIILFGCGTLVLFRRKNNN
ncbi:MAG: PEP-CTERM sorting domain-containing protein [Sedimentisphaerales bacterium]|nr:PEP-CTERM sorting domain-containing protein [Sedimentisphaerales bacterium]